MKCPLCIFHQPGTKTNCYSCYQVSTNTVDGRILHQLIWRIYHYLQGFIYLRWCRISSINSIIFISNMFETIQNKQRQRHRILVATKNTDQGPRDRMRFLLRCGKFLFGVCAGKFTNSHTGNRCFFKGQHRKLVDFRSCLRLTRMSYNCSGLCTCGSPKHTTKSPNLA